MTKEEAMVIVDEAKSLGLAFVEDEFTEDGTYNPTVDRVNAEMYLLDKLISLKC